MERFIIHQSGYQRLLKEFTTDMEQLGYGKNSCKMYPRCVREFLYRMEQQQMNSIRKIRQHHITAHHEYLQQRPSFSRSGGLSISMIVQHMFAIKIFFDYAERTEQLKENPMSALAFKKNAAEERMILSIEEIKALYEAAATLRDKAMLGIVYGCGLRRNEAVQLNTNDIHFKTGLLYVREGKGSKRRVIPMTEKISDDLKNYYLYERHTYIKQTSKATASQELEDPAFILNNSGTRMRGLGYDKLLKAIIERSPVAYLKHAISLHNLRHSIASHLQENGVKLEYVRDFLGHSSLNVTQVYTHIRQRQLQKIKS
jgi:integrase/recombinase XerD